MTTFFYAPPTQFAGGKVRLPADEARHALRVLRLGAGDEITVVDGEGGRHRVRLDAAGRDDAVGTVLETVRVAPPAPLALALGVLHHRDRFEWAAEKAAELGATHFIPLRTTRAAPGKMRRERLESIAVAALKQSLRSHLMQVEGEQSLDEILAPTREGDVLIAHEGAEGAPTPAAASGPARPTVLLIGPEGGFTAAEVDAARAAGATVVGLGPYRLRAETAAAAALADLLLHLR